MYSRRPSIANVYRTVTDHVRNEILSQSDSFIQNSSIDELIEFFFSKNNLQPIELDASRTESLEHKKEIMTVPAHQREEGYRYDGDIRFEFESIIVTIPLVRNSDIHR